MRIHRKLKSRLRTSAPIALVAAMGLSSPALAIVGNDAYTPDQLVDPVDVTGVGQMVIDAGEAYLYVCTATLINPRTVIFAAHCVNGRPAGDYGTASGGTPIGFGFKAANTWPIINWMGAGHRTNTADRIYNSNYVVYNQHSLDLGADNNYLAADIAIASLDTPALDVPAWTLLFSPLTGPTHATIVGYGYNGTGTSGANDFDYRRRVAENTISVLASLNDTETIVAGTPMTFLPQNLYFLDFNDPKFGTAEANQYDFNIYHDAALPKEAMGAPGDSGGPLIVDQLYGKPVIAGVASGVQTFYDGQAISSYGGSSFYQPLYLFWDWIVANNPYKYVSAKSGDASWFDPSHWVINLDPNYTVAIDGQLVNALPTTPAQGIPSSTGVNSPKFGQVCRFDACVDVVTGQPTGTAPAVSTMTGYGNPAEGSASAGGEMVQGAPGSSGFVPNDTEGNPATAAPARYYDVTLSAAGTTTLDHGAAVIDRLTINGATTGLTIGAQGALTTLIDTTIYAGNFHIDGVYESKGDIALMGGVLSGSGDVVAPYATAVLGAFAPGTVGTTGRLSMHGNVIFSSASGLLIDIGPSATDLIDVFGETALGGTVVFMPAEGYVPKWHQSRTFLKSDTITSGTAFAHVPDTIPGVLYPAVSVQASGAYEIAAVSFEAASFRTLLTAPAKDQLQVGDALDGARTQHYAAMTALYDAIDPLSDAPLSAALESLAPDAARAVPKVAALMMQGYSGFIWQHLGDLAHAGRDGKPLLQVQTGALKLVQNSSAGSPQTRDLMSRIGQLNPGSMTGSAAQNAGTLELPKGMGGFLSGSVLDGSVKIGGGGGKASVDGFLIALGLDAPLTDRLRAGISLSLAQATARLRQSPGRTGTNMVQAVAYARYDTADGWFASGFAGGATQAVHTERSAAGSDIIGHTTGSSPLFGLTAGKIIDLDGGEIAPAAGLQYASPTIHGYGETGGDAAMSFAPVDDREVDVRLGFDASARIDLGAVMVEPSAHAFFVANLDRTTPVLHSAFVAAPANLMVFDAARAGPQWAELGIGAKIELWQGATVGVHYSADVGRSDLSYGAWSGTLHLAF